MKTIFRSACKSHFVQLPNQMLRDNSISLRARGLLAMVLTHQEEWVITKSWITEQVKEGKQAVASTFRELERSGYAVMHEDRSEVGKIVSRTWTFHDSPVPEPERSQATNRTASSAREGENPHAGNPACGNSACGQPATKNTMEEEDNLKEHQFRKANEAIRKPPAEPKQRPRNEVFDAVAEVCGFNPNELTKSAAARVGVGASQLAAYTPEEIKKRAFMYKKMHPTWELTPTSLASHWPTLGEKQKVLRPVY